MIRQKIAIIDKAPSKTRYSDYFKFEFDRNDSDLERLKAKIMHARIYIKNNLL